MTPPALGATYRLQLGGGFGFAQARELVPYLRDLGVSHLYLPPSFQAREGSTHGYDVVDPTSISNELGGEAEFFALAQAVREAGPWVSTSSQKGFALPVPMWFGTMSRSNASPAPAISATRRFRASSPPSSGFATVGSATS